MMKNHIINLNKKYFPFITLERIILILLVIISIITTIYSHIHGYVISYGDAESHLNIAKRVIDSPTPGFSQLGGIWLPLPHMLMVPFVLSDTLWRTGLAGSIVSGISYVVSGIFLYKLTFLVSKNKIASVFAASVFALNPNILYMQTTPMSELPLIAFFILSVYFFVRFLYNTAHFEHLILAAFFGFAASLSRYDGWFLVAIEGLILGIYFIVKNGQRWKWAAYIMLFSTLAFLGIALWLLWDFLILGDPLYFSNSPFSANSQQQGWLARGELPTYRDLPLSITYYFVTALRNSGIIVSILSIVGLIAYIFSKKGSRKLYVPLLLLFPFIFYVVTLYIGQSVIFIPDLTPETFEWNLFNVRYGIMMVPFVAFFLGFLFFKSHRIIKIILFLFLIIQTFSFTAGYEKVFTYEDGVNGLSSARGNDAQNWLRDNYDDGRVLLDDYARTLSILRTRIPMENVIYIGNKPYWEESLENPEKHVKWIIMQENDAVWENFIKNQVREDHLYKFYNRVYTSPNILIFRLINS